MKIAVCVKQVPKGDALIDNKTGLLIRKELKTNLYDYFAIETALQIKDKIGGSVDIFSLAPNNAINNFKEYYALGVNNCYLVSDKAFKGADVFATSYALSQAIKSTDNYDLIICGRQTEDGDTSSVGASIAETLNLVSVMYVKEIVSICEESITLKRELTSSFEEIQVKLPCVICIDKDSVIVRIPSLMSKLKSSKMEAKLVTLNDLDDKDTSHYGEQGSKTKVVKIYEETPLKKGVEINGDIKDISDFIIKEANKVKGKN